MKRSLMIGAAALTSALLAAPAFAEDPPAAPAQAQSSTTASASYSDAQLTAFAQANTEIAPLQAAPQTTDAERQAVLTQMRDVLTRHNLTAAQYNEIVGAVRADPALAQRVAQLSPAQAGGTTGAP